MKNKLLPVLIPIIALSSILIAFGTPLATPFQPNQTLDPNCAPGDTNCFVQFNDQDNQRLTITGSLLSISNGNSVSIPSGHDNLGDHTARSNIALDWHWVSGDWQSNGLYVATGGRVGIGTNALTAQLTVSGSADIRSINAIRFADQFPGATAGAKITNAINDLPSEWGVVDARGLTGTQTNWQPLQIGSATKTVSLLLGRTTLVTSAPITLDRASSITGLPQAMGIGNDYLPSAIKAASGSNLTAVVRLVGGFNVLRDLTVDGNKANNSGTAPNVEVLDSGRVKLDAITSQNATGDGILITSSLASPSASCCAKLSNVMSLRNGGSGLHIVNTTDTFVQQSEFEDNELHWLELTDASGTRVTLSDFWWNHENGIKMASTNSQKDTSYQIITTSQFGNNYKNDVLVLGPSSHSHIITNNSFIGSANRVAWLYDAISISDSMSNTIEANFFTFNTNTGYRSGVRITNATSRNIVTGNTFYWFPVGAAISASPWTYVASNLDSSSSSITYSGRSLFTGPVGVGGEDAKFGSQLYTKGALGLTDGLETSNGQIVAGSNRLSIEAFNGDNTGKNPIILNAWGGSVWIGNLTPQATLDVGGAIRIAWSNASCTSATAGSIRYNTANSKHEGCNWTGWNPLY
jgi:hypothetical protein